MKKIFITISLIILVMLLSACSTTTNDIKINDVQTNPTNIDDLDNSQNNLDDSPTNNVVPSEQNNNKLLKMKYCYSKPSAPVVYKYYIADNEIYIKTNAGGGSIEKIVKNGEICTKSSDAGFKSWNCIPTSSNSLSDEKEAAELQTTGSLKDVFDFKCSIIDYDESKFDTSN